MSDSKDGKAVPADSTIEDTLRQIVHVASKNDEEVSIKLARTRAEQQLGLDEGFLKGEVWKDRSKAIITAAFEEETASPEKPKKEPPKPKAGAKRKSDDTAGEGDKKRRKKSPVVESEEKDEFVDSDARMSDDDAPKAKATTQSKSKSGDTSGLSSPPNTDDQSPPPESKKASAPKPTTNDDDDSDLSSLIDDVPPPKKKRQRKTSAASTTTKPQKSSKAAAKVSSKPAKEISPEEEEIKRLQSYLIKCGVRKLWHRELAHCESSKEKIKHLKGMLEDVGMTGRFSAEKAAKIKEERELKAELESAREFNEQWGREKGAKDAEDEGEKVESKGRLKPKGLVDFGDDSDDSE